MSVFSSLVSLFFTLIDNVVNNWIYFVYFISAGFVCALVFNIIHVFLGGGFKHERGRK